jgi:hypothetical protein
MRERGGGGSPQARVPAISGVVASRDLTSVTFRRLSEAMEMCTACRRVRRTRLRDCRGRLLPRASRRHGRREHGRRWGSAEGDWLDSLQNRTSGGNFMMRQSRERRIGQERELGIPWLGRNRWISAAGTAGSGELFRQPGGIIRSGMMGEMERIEGDICRRGRASN